MDKGKQLRDYISAEDNINVVRALEAAMGIWGYVPEEAKEIIACELKISLAHVEGVRSFYSYLHDDSPVEVELRACKSGPCHVCGSEDTLKELENALGIQAGQCTADGRIRLISAGCIGACDRSPAIMVNGKVFGPIYAGDVKELLAQLKEEK